MLKTICNRCGRSYQVGSKCSCRNERNRYYDKYQRNQDAKKIYNSSAWKSLVQICKAQCFGADVYVYAMTGRIIPARNGLVHHIVEVSEVPELAYDIDNLVYVGSASHKAIHDAYKNEKEKMQRILREAKERLMRAGG